MGLLMIGATMLVAGLAYRRGYAAARIVMRCLACVVIALSIAVDTKLLSFLARELGPSWFALGIVISLVWVGFFVTAWVRLRK